MCGFLFVEQAGGNRITSAHFEATLNQQGWRVPDSHNQKSLNAYSGVLKINLTVN